MGKDGIESAERDRRSLDARDRELAAMGYGSFDEYLQSPLFAEVRRALLARMSRCGCCPLPASVVHFYSYRKKDLDGSDLGRLFAVCEACEWKSRVRESDGQPLTATQADSKLRQMATVYRRRITGR